MRQIDTCVESFAGTHENRRPPTPSGFWRSWSGPAPKPSS